MEPNLRERTFGCLEGRPFKTMQDEAAARGLTTWEYTPEGAESHQDVSNRADAFLMVSLMTLTSLEKRFSSKYVFARISSAT